MVFLSGSEYEQAFFFYRLFIRIDIGDSIIKRSWDPINCLTPPHVCPCPKSGFGFPTSYVVVFFYSMS